MAVLVTALHTAAGLAAQVVAVAIAGLATVGFLLIAILLIGFIVSCLKLGYDDYTSASRDSECRAVSPTSPGFNITEAMIAERAYLLYEVRGREPGRDIEDWLQAERELTACM